MKDCYQKSIYEISASGFPQWKNDIVPKGKCFWFWVALFLLLVFQVPKVLPMRKACALLPCFHWYLLMVLILFLFQRLVVVFFQLYLSNVVLPIDEGTIPGLSFFEVFEIELANISDLPGKKKSAPPFLQLCFKAFTICYKTNQPINWSYIISLFLSSSVFNYTCFCTYFFNWQ